MSSLRMLNLVWRSSLLAVTLALASCVSDLPIDTTFDNSAGDVSCEILGDGFVQTGDRRIPIESFILELRQTTRAMTREEVRRFVVGVRFAPGSPDGVAAEQAVRGREYLLQQLQIMGVRQTSS